MVVIVPGDTVKLIHRCTPPIGRLAPVYPGRFEGYQPKRTGRKHSLPLLVK